MVSNVQNQLFSNLTDIEFSVVELHLPCLNFFNPVKCGLIVFSVTHAEWDVLSESSTLRIQGKFYSADLRPFEK
jgi:hypothetical protein